MTPKIQALGITQEWLGTSWKATGHVEGVGWLTAWGPSLPAALAALQALAAEHDSPAASLSPTEMDAIWAAQGTTPPSPRELIPHRLWGRGRWPRW